MRGSGRTDIDYWETYVIGAREVHCRNCQHFYRVDRKRGARGAAMRQGFCSLGQMEGDYGLYVSTSFSHECQAFKMDRYNSQTTALEDDLSNELQKVREKSRDHRSRLHKAIKEFAMKTQSEFDLSQKHWMLNWLEEDAMVANWFWETHKDDYCAISDRLHINENDYHRILATLRTKIDEFCEGKITEQSTVKLEAKI